ncbi:MAG TPA: hypothetical protein VEI02_16415 [Planctomycetota bacterium]|nr:hypothetical protein [Planctomycetota bacterium]
MRLFAAVVVAVVATRAPAQLLANLLTNPGAEAGAPSPTGFTVVPVPGWTTTSNATVVPWTIGGGFPVTTDPGPPNRGAAFFAGGPNTASSTFSQSHDVSAFAPLIDAGAAAFVLSGWLGGFATQDDQAVFTATFKSSGGGTLGTASIGPVTQAERGNATALLYRSLAGTLPAGTRSATFTLHCVRMAGSYDDGYADELGFALGVAASAASLGGGCGAGAPPTLTAAPPVLGGFFNLAVAGATPNGAGEILFSLPGAPPLGIGPCAVHIDLGAFLSLTPVFVDALGGWTLSLPLPFDPNLAGFALVLQGYVAPAPGAPLGIDLTNGVLVVAGL